MFRRVAMVIVAIALLVAAGCGSDSPAPVPTASPTVGIRLQPVNNDFVIAHVDKRLAEMTDEQKVKYLALYACSAEITMLGVYGPLADNPIMDRWNELNERYNTLYAESDFGGRKAEIPGSLFAAMDEYYCKGDHPL